MSDHEQTEKWSFSTSDGYFHSTLHNTSLEKHQQNIFDAPNTLELCTMCSERYRGTEIWIVLQANFQFHLLDKKNSFCIHVYRNKSCLKHIFMRNSFHISHLFSENQVCCLFIGHHSIGDIVSESREERRNSCKIFGRSILPRNINKPSENFFNDSLTDEGIEKLPQFIRKLFSVSEQSWWKDVCKYGGRCSGVLVARMTLLMTLRMTLLWQRQLKLKVNQVKQKYFTI